MCGLPGAGPFVETESIGHRHTRLEEVFGMAAFDLLIKGGTVIDGTGRPGFGCDVGISGDRVAAIETDIHRDSAKSVISADGKAVAPGFIDAHCHTDWSIR